jgi:hypothetical protein
MVPSDVRQRFGVDVLRGQLSQQLVDLTQRELPKMQKALDSTLAHVESDLEKLPAPPSADRSLQLRLLLTRLGKAVDCALHPPHSLSDPKATHFAQAVRGHYKKLRVAVEKTQPRVDLQQGSSSSSSFSTGDGSSQRPGEEDVVFWWDADVDEDTEDAGCKDPAGSRRSRQSAVSSSSKADTEDQAPLVITLEYARQLAEVSDVKLKLISCHYQLLTVALHAAPEPHEAGGSYSAASHRGQGQLLAEAGG